MEHTIQHFFLRQKARHPFLLYYNAIHDDFFPFRKRRKGIAEKSCGFMLQPGLGIVVAGGAGTIYTGMVRHQINEKAAAAQTYSIDIVVVQYAMYSLLQTFNFEHIFYTNMSCLQRISLLFCQIK